MSNDQFNPLTEGEEEPKSISETIRALFIYYYFFEKINNNNNKGIMWERFIKTCMKWVATSDGSKFLKYLYEREAYTIGVASYHTGVDQNKLYRYTVPLLNMGIIMKNGKLGAKGERGSPTLIYALRDASQSRIDAAAQLYKDITSSHVNSLDEYLKDYDYTKAAEEVIANHLLPDGSVSSYAITRILVRMNLDHDKHRDNVRRILQSMGYNIRQGE